MTRKKKNEVAKSPQNSSEWHALLEREGLLLLWELIIVISAHTSYLSFFLHSQIFLENKIYTEKRQFFALNL